MISMDEAEYPGYGGPDPADSDHDSGSSASLERNWPAKLSSRRCHDLDQISLVANGRGPSGHAAHKNLRLI
jgi:hypothetical protein